MRNTDAGNNTGGADGTRTDTHFHTVGTIFHEVLSCFASSDITHHYINLWERALHLLKNFYYTLSVTVSSVDNDSVNACFNKRFSSLEAVASHANTGSYTQTAESVLASVWFVFSLGDVFVGDQTDEFTIFVNYREFFNFVSLENVGSLVKVG